jgi:hypothetical protein
MTTTIEATRLTKPFGHDLAATLPVLAGLTRRADRWMRLCPATTAAELAR